MTYLNEEVREIADKSNLWMLSTINDDGSPRTIPVHFKKIQSADEIMLVSNFMTVTLNNLEERRDKVSLTFWTESIVCHLKGIASSYYSGETFQRGVEMVKAKRPNLNPKSVIIFKITSAQTWHRPG